MYHQLRSHFSKAHLVLCAALLIHVTLIPNTRAEPSELFANAADGTPLHWVVYTPATSGPWPAVIVIHGGGFSAGSPTSSPESVNCARDLAAAGFIAFSIEYRLAPEGFLPGQVSDGRFPDQSNDVKLAVLAARQDARCNGQVGAVGGSAGGYQTAFVAGTGTVGQDRVDVGVGLSGAYDLSDFSPDPGINAFIGNVTNYVGVSESDIAALQAASPAYLADANTAPLLLVNTEQDPMPFSQLADMTTKLDALGLVNYQTVTFPGSQHAFAYWPLIKDQALAFLASGFAGVPPPAKAPSPSQLLLNVSTRVRVQSGTGVMIGGFIIAGDVPKRVVLRAMGPSLSDAGITDVLRDPVLELYDSTGSLVAQNDNCSSLPPDQIPTGLKPFSGRESLISVTLPQGSYTGVLRGANGATGVGLFELYDLDAASSRLTNISTRGEVGSGSDAMIGGFIIGGDDPTKVIVRAIGPSLAASNIPNPMADPLLDLYDTNGSLISSNDDWRSAQAEQIIASGVPPSDDREAAIVATLLPGGYTAMVRSAVGSEGVALFEVYDLESN
jgi:acetyl esterase/lipase